MEYTSLEDQVAYGLEAVPTDRDVTVPLRDLLYVYQVMGELTRYFHQPMHFPTLEAVQDFLGDKEQGGLHLIADCYYHRLSDMLPPTSRLRLITASLTILHRLTTLEMRRAGKNIAPGMNSRSP